MYREDKGIRDHKHKYADKLFGMYTEGKEIESVDNEDITGKHDWGSEEMGGVCGKCNRLGVGQCTGKRLRKDAKNSRSRRNGNHQSSETDNDSGDDEPYRQSMEGNTVRGGIVHGFNVVSGSETRLCSATRSYRCESIRPHSDNVQERQVGAIKTTTILRENSVARGVEGKSTGMVAQEGRNFQQGCRKGSSSLVKGSVSDSVPQVFSKGGSDPPSGDGSTTRCNKRVHVPRVGRDVSEVHRVGLERVDNESGDEEMGPPTLSNRDVRYWRLMGVEYQSGFKVVKKGIDVWGEEATSADWPIHAPEIGTIHTRALREASTWSDNGEVFRWLWDVNLYPTMKPVINEPRSRVGSEDVRQLIRNGIFRKITNGNAQGIIFTVGEPGKRRRRLVHDALLPNVLTSRPWNPEFAPIREIRKLVTKGSWAVSVDFKAYYYQFALDRTVQRYFTVWTNSGHLVPTRLPMGFSWAVDIAQEMSRYLCRGIGGIVDIYIDNILIIAGSEAEGEIKLATLLKECGRCGVTVGTILKGEVVEHRGMMLNFKNKSVRLKEGFVEKLRTRFDSCEWTWGQVRSLIGMCTYSYDVWGIPMGRLYDVFKFWSRYTYEEPDKVLNVWKSVREIFEGCVKQASREALVKEVYPRENIIVVTDASWQEGWGTLGGMLIGDDVEDVFSVSLKFRTRTVAETEAMAIRYGIQRWKSRLQHKVINLYCDNAVVIYGYAKGSSKDYGVNKEILEIMELVSEMESILRLHYITSETNPADALTRNGIMTLKQEACLESWLR